MTHDLYTAYPLSHIISNYILMNALALRKINFPTNKEVPMDPFLSSALYNFTFNPNSTYN